MILDVPHCIVMSCSHAIDPDVLYDMCNIEVYSDTGRDTEAGEGHVRELVHE